MISRNLFFCLVDVIYPSRSISRHMTNIICVLFYRMKVGISNPSHMGRKNLTERRLLRYETLETSAQIEDLRFFFTFSFLTFEEKILNFCRNISKMTRFWKIQKKSSSGKKSKNLFEKQIDFAGKNHNYS